MPSNYTKTKGPVKSSQPDVGGANIYKTPVFGIVKDVIDPIRAGRIKVFIGETGAKDSNNPSSWVTVKFMSSFFGKVEPTAPQTGLGTYKENPSSYGQWQSPPDIGTRVLCIFVNGDPNYGFYIGADPDPEALHMVPAIGASDYIVANEGEANSFGGATRLPVTNINSNDKKTADSNKFNETARPVHSYSAAIMSQQGVIRDPIRGPISSSASREPASRVGWGVSSPGRPIYEGGYTDETIVDNLKEGKPQELRVVARRGGHSIVMDDGDIIGNDQLIRIRTALGHQITMSDDGQTLMILHSNGQSYVELGKEGTVDIYATNSFNVRSQGDINFHADQHMNFHANEKMNFFAKNVQYEMEEDFKLRAGKNIVAYALENVTAKADGTVAFKSEKEISIESAGPAFVTGKKVNLNTGKCGTDPEKLEAQQITGQTDTLFDKETGFSAAPGKLLSITSRAPAHAPWADAGKGVEVKVDLNASSSLPQAASPAVEKANEQAAQLGASAPAVATVASVPNNTPISGAMDAGTTNAVMGAVATTAATGPVQNAVTKGATCTADGSAVGSFALTATQLSTAGITKPGSEHMINAIAKSTGSITQAYPSCVFTGAPGAQDLTSFAKNVGAQAGAVSTAAQKSQTELTNAGVISGKEAGEQVAGLITSATLVGVAETAAAVCNISDKSSSALTSVAGLLSGKAGGGAGQSFGQFGDVDVYTVSGGLNSAKGLTSNPLAAMALGVAAAGLAGKLGGLGSIKAGLALSIESLVNQARGAVTAAFNSIKSAFKPLQPRVPQNLNIKAKKRATDQEANAGMTPQVKSIVDAATKNKTGTNLVVSSDVGALADKYSSATGAINGLTGAGSVISTGQTDKLGSAAKFVQSGASGSVSAQLASGVTSVSGGASTFSSTVNNKFSANNTIAGTSTLKGYINEAQSSAMHNVAPTLPALPKTAGSLTSTVQSKMPIGDVSKLNTKISSVSGSSPGATKAPTSAVNTVERSQMTAQMDNIIQDPKIPKPNLVGETNESARETSKERLSELKEQLAQADNKARETEEERIKLMEKARKLQQELPAGDVRVEDAFLAANKKHRESIKSLNESTGIKSKISSIERTGVESAGPDLKTQLAGYTGITFPK